MDSCEKDAPAVPTFLEILAGLPIEDQRAALAWLREVGTELGCTIVYDEVFVAKEFLDFLSGSKAVLFLN